MSADTNSSLLFDSLKCPITHELFRDPVIGSDGHTYERRTIIAWIEKHATSPITREPMNIASLRPNYIVKKMVDEFLSLSLQKEYQFRLDVDVCKTKQQPLFQSSTKTIFEAKWMLKHGPQIVLIRIDGARAKCEASFYVQLSCHPHIVRTYGLVSTDSLNSVTLVQEYAPEGDLRRLFRNNNFQPTYEVLLEIFEQIVDAMICLADNQIVHGDLACRNVLVFRSSRDQSTEILVKLTDFGLTRASPLFSVDESLKSKTATMIPVRHAAPEILSDKSATSYTEKSDVYSFGVLMWEACSGGAAPYSDLRTSDSVYQERLRGKILERPHMCSDELWKVIMSCTQQDATNRPNFKNIRKHLSRLRFQDQPKLFNRTSPSYRDDTLSTTLTPTIVLASHNDPQRTLHEYININTQPLDQDDECTIKNQMAHYRNLNNCSDEYRSSFSTEFDDSPSNYYTPCEYCLQSVNLNELTEHLEVCSVRSFVRSFAKAVAKLPPLEIASCSSCDDMIPLNMLHIHMKTCKQNSTHLYNTSEASSQWPSRETSNYLKPISIPHRSGQGNLYLNTPTARERTENAPRRRNESEPPRRPSSDNEATVMTSTVSKKSGLRRFFSKLKNKI